MPSIAETAVEMIEWVFPEHAGGPGQIHGGRMMEWITKAGTLAASRVARGTVVLGAMDDIDFLHPVKVGQIAILRARVEDVGTSSLEVGVRVFADAIPPALHIFPGDTVRTWTVDAGGTDSNGVRCSQGGNPQTGPFYVEGAFPGDTLVLKLNRIRLNRDSAASGNQIAHHRRRAAIRHVDDVEAAGRGLQLLAAQMKDRAETR